MTALIDHLADAGLVASALVAPEVEDHTARADQGYHGIDYMTADDIADVVCYIAALPTRVNVNLIQLMPPQQGYAGYAFDRR